ncbi:MAG: aryl-sulfate sulfotransferase [Halosimplex sp.]
MDVSRGSALVLFGVGLFVATMLVGAATAPSSTAGVGGVAGSSTPTPTPSPATETPVPSDGDGTATPAGTPAATEPQTLVGVQGGWVSHGSVLGFEGTDVAWRNTQADGYFEVTRLDDGSVLATFANESGPGDCGPYESPCAHTGYRVLDPATGEIRSEYSVPVPTITNREVHAAKPTGNGGIVYTDMNEERIVVVENGTEVWEWRASSIYEEPAHPTRRDWLHINDVDVIGDGRFLVSVRNANQLVIVQRGEGVVEIVNEDTGTSDANCLKDGRLADANGDGDVRCGDPSVIKEQHNPQWLGDGAVLVADSENDRVVELHRTENGSWEPVWTVSEAGGQHLSWPRDADRLPDGDTLITDSLNKRVLEVNPRGEVVWQVRTDRVVRHGPGIPYEADRLPYGEYGDRYDGTTDGTATDGGTGTDGGGTATGETAIPTETPLPRMTAANGSGVATGGTAAIPLLSEGVAGIRGTVSWVPVWFGETHLAVTALALVLVVVGGVDHLLASRSLPGRE